MYRLFQGKFNVKKRSPGAFSLIRMGSSASKNADVLSNLEPKVTHLEPSQQSELVALLKEFEYLFDDEPKNTDLTCHDVDMGF